ncbi:hypothetical protein BH20ACT5_BH20ACT5_22310 [soil metagenome]
MTALLERPVELAPATWTPAPRPRRRLSAVQPLPAIPPPVRDLEPTVIVPCAPMSGRSRRIAEPAPFRLTRRGTALIGVLIAVCTMAVIALGALNAPAAPSPREAPASVVVQPGDSLWQIATEVAPAEHPTVVIERIRAANDLGTGPLRPGQTLVLPAG